MLYLYIEARHVLRDGICGEMECCKKVREGGGLNTRGGSAFTVAVASLL